MARTDLKLTSKLIAVPGARRNVKTRERTTRSRTDGRGERRNSEAVHESAVTGAIVLRALVERHAQVNWIQVLPGAGVRRTHAARAAGHALHEQQFEARKADDFAKHSAHAHVERVRQLRADSRARLSAAVCARRAVWRRHGRRRGEQRDHSLSTTSIKSFRQHEIKFHCGESRALSGKRRRKSRATSLTQSARSQ